MPCLTDIGYLRDLLSRHGFSFSKKLGQNFIVNPGICPKMAEAAVQSVPEGPVGVLEIGPGVGVLTKELAARAEKVIAVELDDRLPPVLAETLADCPNFTLVQGDALKLDLAALLAPYGNLHWVVCANLPYYITSPLIMHLLESRLPVRSITVMVQKEAADRLCADPGTRECGAVSLAVRYYAEAQVLFRVSRGSFLPAPNVDSSVIQLTCRETPTPCADEKKLFRVIRAAFAQRRKTLSNALKNGGFAADAVAAAFAACGLSPQARAEELTLPQFIALSAALP